MTHRVVSWFSCGAASAVATKLIPDAIPVYCETGSEHPDNERFLSCCEEWFERKVTRIKSEKYVDTWDVWKKRNFMVSIHGAPCTTELKVKPRLVFQRPDDHHVFGYTSDPRDRNRAKRLRENFPELTILTPLIKHDLTKERCLAIIKRAGIQVPVVYGLGFQNNNCLPCVKATSPSYWALFRKQFPDKFNRIAKMSRGMNQRLAEIHGEHIFIDEIPLDFPIKDVRQPSCDFICQHGEIEIEKAENETEIT